MQWHCHIFSWCTSSREKVSCRNEKCCCCRVSKREKHVCLIVCCPAGGMECIKMPHLNVRQMWAVMLLHIQAWWLLLFSPTTQSEPKRVRCACSCVANGLQFIFSTAIGVWNTEWDWWTVYQWGGRRNCGQIPDLPRSGLEAACASVLKSTFI